MCTFEGVHVAVVVTATASDCACDVSTQPSCVACKAIMLRFKKQFSPERIFGTESHLTQWRAAARCAKGAPCARSPAVAVRGRVPACKKKKKNIFFDFLKILKSIKKLFINFDKMEKHVYAQCAQRETTN